MGFAKHYLRFMLLPGALSLIALIALLAWGLKPGIDLAGGSLLELSFPEMQPTAAQIAGAVAPLNLGEVRVQPAGAHAYLLRLRVISAQEKNEVEAAIAKLAPAQETQFTSIGPSLGAEVLDKGLLAIALIVVAIILFIAFAFRKVSEPVASWKYGIVTIVTLVHDILIPAGMFAILGRFAGAEVDSLFIVALLTILGISINDTIVVFDRIRENVSRNAAAHRREEFGETVERSIMQTLARSINTSLTVIFVLLALYFLGPAATQTFALTLLIGMIAGTYSSIFLASPLLVLWERWGKVPAKAKQ